MAAMADDAPRSRLDAEIDAASRRRARKWWIVAGAFAVVVGGVLMWLGRQDSSAEPAPRAFCRAAARFDDETQRTQEAYEIDIERQIRLVEDIAATAPPDVRDDAQIFLDALRKIQAAPNDKARAELQDDPRVEDAVVNVNRRWNQGCGVFDRRSGI